MRIITVSRQFGSGGRELGKKLAEKLGWDYYDKNIIEKLCEQENLDEDYVRRVFHDGDWSNFAESTQGTFSQIGVNSGWQLSLLSKQREIIENIASLGRDCVIVGRDADVILGDRRPFRIFVCADLPFRLARCMKREEKNPEGKRLNEKQVMKNIKKIDRTRIRTREILTGKSFSDPSTFDLTVNSASFDVEMLAEHVTKLALGWFEDEAKR